MKLRFAQVIAYKFKKKVSNVKEQLPKYRVVNLFLNIKNMKIVYKYHAQILQKVKKNIILKVYPTVSQLKIFGPLNSVLESRKRVTKLKTCTCLIEVLGASSVKELLPCLFFKIVVYRNLVSMEVCAKFL